MHCYTVPVHKNTNFESMFESFKYKKQKQVNKVLMDDANNNKERHDKVTSRLGAPGSAKRQTRVGAGR